ncbi:uncharacterized protein LOC143886845 isoform X2 [Tasmannia lanceolata]|uniref:uncharacterized protein LOC143886845 isoform X2 n=1 Tax=Tasmannia lanceolata TaxID=3420 RepID=UPI0040649771
MSRSEWKIPLLIERRRSNGDPNLFSDDSLGGVRGREKDHTMSSNFLDMTAILSSPGMNYIEHRVSKMDTLAGVAIKYGVEVADIRRMNGLVTDLQMFAHKSLQIPLPGRHPPSPILSNGSLGPGESSIEQTPPRRPHSDLLESFQSLKLKSPQQRVSPAMSSLQGFYGLTRSKNRGSTEGTEMAVYKKGGALYLEDADLPPTPTRHRKTRSLVNGFLPENGDLSEDLMNSEAYSDPDRSNQKSVQMGQKANASDGYGNGYRTPELLLKEDSGSMFSGITGKGLALRPKSASRTSPAVDMDSSRLNPIPMGDSIADSFFSGVRKSSSTSNLQDPESNSSIWPTSKWAAKLDLQARTTAAIARPIFDGLPKPISGRRNKAALD